MVIVGWLFGLLTPGIAERIKRPYRRKELTAAIVDEMGSLQYVMAVMACTIRSRYADVSDAFLDEILPMLEAYDGPDRDEKFIEGMKKLRALPEAERKLCDEAMRKGSGVTRSRLSKAPSGPAPAAGSHPDFVAAPRAASCRTVTSRPSGKRQASFLSGH